MNAGKVLANPRNQKKEIQALQDTIYVVGGEWPLLIINSTMATEGFGIIIEASGNVYTDAFP